MIHDLQNKTALITGASRGLGLHIAQQFWTHGANLVLIARSEKNLEQLSEQLSKTAKSNQTIQVIATDLSNSKSFDEIATRCDFSAIDIVVNNAAIQGPIGPVWENNWDEWQNTIQVDLLTPIALCRAVTPHMIKRNFGKIINLSGGGATGPRANFSAYAVAKAGLVRFSETLASEVEKFNISVNCIAPGVMNTDMLAQIIEAGASKVGEKEFTQVNRNKNNNNSTIERAAELCCYLASEKSNGITGKLISAVWDPWKNLTDYLQELQQSDIYTLRRIVPKDRGKAWGEVT